MKWVTRDHVHMDRVASPWLIRRFIDRDAEFVFVPFAAPDPIPQDAIPFGLPGVELGRDAEGSSFRKILQKYRLEDRALEIMAQIIESGIVHVFSQIDHGYTDIAALKYHEGIGLDAVCQGMMLVAADDNSNIEQSSVIFDALYAYCRIKILQTDKPEILKILHPQQWDVIKSELSFAETA